MSLLHNNKKTNVLIVGGGISGLACGSELRKNPNFNVILLEANDRIGGRVNTVKFGANTVELGAQWIHGEENNKIFSLAQKFGVTEDEGIPAKFGTENVAFVTQRGEFLSQIVSEKSAEFIHDLLFEVENKPELEKESFGHYVEAEFWKTNEERPIHSDENICAGILDWMHRFQNSIDGSESWFITSYQGQIEYEKCDGNPTVPWKKPASYSTLFQIILDGKPSSEPLSVPDWILLNKEVTNIRYNDSEIEEAVQVTCKDGDVHNVDHVVCTVSLGVLKSTSLFTPPLSEQREKAIQNLGFDTVDKIFLEFESPWWPQGTVGFNLIYDDCCKVKDNWQQNPSPESLLQDKDGIPIFCRSLLGFYTLKANPNILYSWITGPPAHIMETLSYSNLEEALMKVLKQFFGSAFDVTKPKNILRSGWNSNPYTRGSYSFRSVESERNDVFASQLAEPILNDKGIPVICFAGEHTHPGYFSTVHGAYESGLREANRLAEHTS